MLLPKAVVLPNVMIWVRALRGGEAMLFNVIITIMAFLYMEFVGVGFLPTRTLEYTRITQGGTFSRHLEDIRLLGDRWPTLTEHDMQLMRLREFAKNLNAGGTELSCLRVTYVWGHPYRSTVTWCDITQQVYHRFFDVTFMHEEDYNNAALIEEMLAFMGIHKDSIRITLNQTGQVAVIGNAGHFEFLLPNQAVYEVMRPYLRLRDFAMRANSAAAGRDETVVISVVDAHRLRAIGQELAGVAYPRFYVRLSQRAFSDRELRYEMLDYAGLEPHEVAFQWTRVNPWEANQDIIGPQHEQQMRLSAFMDLVGVRSARRNIVMDMVTWGWAPPGFRGDSSSFTVGVAEYNFNNMELRETLLAFTGIAEDNIEFEPPMIFSVSWHPIRRDLTPRRQVNYDTLRAFQEKVNAPFWYDRYQHDPVIVQVNLVGRWRLRSHSRFILHNYHIMLYDQDLAGRSNISIAWRTRALRREIVAATGIRNIRFRAFEPPAWQV